MDTLKSVLSRNPMWARPLMVKIFDEIPWRKEYAVLGIGHHHQQHHHHHRNASPLGGTAPEGSGTPRDRADRSHGRRDGSGGQRDAKGPRRYASPGGGAPPEASGTPRDRADTLPPIGRHGSGGQRGATGPCRTAATGDGMAPEGSGTPRDRAEMLPQGGRTTANAEKFVYGAAPRTLQIHVLNQRSDAEGTWRTTGDEFQRIWHRRSAWIWTVRDGAPHTTTSAATGSTGPSKTS